jgi:hypothetical protein
MKCDNNRHLVPNVAPCDCQNNVLNTAPIMTVKPWTKTFENTWKIKDGTNKVIAILDTEELADAIIGVLTGLYGGIPNYPADKPIYCWNEGNCIMSKQCNGCNGVIDKGENICCCSIDTCPHCGWELNYENHY